MSELSRDDLLNLRKTAIEEDSSDLKDRFISKKYPSDIAKIKITYQLMGGLGEVLDKRNIPHSNYITNEIVNSSSNK